jgi:hypothetical protein
VAVAVALPVRRVLVVQVAVELVDLSREALRLQEQPTQAVAVAVAALILHALPVQPVVQEL